MAAEATDAEQELLSDLPIPPGETIPEGIEYHGITRKELARKTGLSVQAVDELLLGELPVLPVTERIAEELEKSLGIPARMLLRLEERYRRTLARRRELSTSSS